MLALYQYNCAKCVFHWLQVFSVEQVKCKKSGGDERIIYQYHYTNWPDHGTPDHPLPVLSFVHKSAAANPDDGGPIIVHCRYVLFPLPKKKHENTTAKF